MKNRTLHKSLLMAALVMAAAAGAPAAHGGATASYLYSLADVTGSVPYSEARVVIDGGNNETYVLAGNVVRIFNDAGMEVYRFGNEQSEDHIVDLALDDQGNILTLAHRNSDFQIVRCDFRGEPKERIEVSDVPASFTPFSPNRMAYRDDRLYLADTNAMRIAIADSGGRFGEGYDIIAILGLTEKDRADTGISGFSVDGEGNMVFTIPVLFSAYRLSPDRTIQSFGQPGSIPGKFNVVGGIARDSRGSYLVADLLKCVVMIFDHEFRFLTEFGYRGNKPGNLIVPQDVAVDGNGRVYVTQGRKRGISVFRISYD